SAFLALSLTPALCATLLRPVSGEHHEKRGFFGWFNRFVARSTQRYATRVGTMLKKPVRWLVVYGALTAAAGLMLTQLPTAFLPDEDQGYFITSFLMPADSTAERTHDVVKTLEKHLASRPAIRSSISVIGYGFSGQGPNAAINWSVMKDWKDRGDASTLEEGMRAQQAMAGVTEGAVMSLLPPAIDELGNSSGFAMRLEDRANQGTAALKAAEAKLLELAAQSKVVTGVYPDSLPAGTSIRLEIDRAKA
ncbi:efflux RND transporter permease subunit, partial [Ralstonia pickettii]|nr:efflux RND transporter permease subunit [Ralstonia pickettii]